MKKTLLLMLGTILLTGAGCSVGRLSLTGINATSTPDLPKGQTLFVGQSCPRCEVVENRLKKNPSNLAIEIKEVYNNGVNAAQLVKVIKYCGLSIANTGVPLLWDGQRCHEGDDLILKYLKERMIPSTDSIR